MDYCAIDLDSCNPLLSCGKKKNVLNSLISVWKGTYQDVREGKIPLYLLCKGQKVT